jgi:hypothetical protein
MMKQLDFVSDQNPTSIHEALLESDCPAYIKSADPLEQAEVQGLAKNAFADQKNRLHPVHTKFACWMSAAYLFGGGNIEGPVVDELEKAASAHGITEDIESLREFWMGHEKVASSHEDGFPKFAMRLETPEGVKGYYPIHDGPSTVASSEYLQTVFDDNTLPIEYAREPAEQIMKAASRHSIPREDLSDVVLQLGERRLPSFMNAKSAAVLRGAVHGLSKEHRDVYMDLVDNAQQAWEEFDTDDARFEAVDKYASLMVEVDAQLGIKPSGVVESPFQAFYKGAALSDIDQLAKSHVSLSGALVPRQVFAGLTPDLIDAHFTKTDDMRQKVANVVSQAAVGGVEASQYLERDFDAEGEAELLRVLAKYVQD